MIDSLLGYFEISVFKIARVHCIMLLLFFSGAPPPSYESLYGKLKAAKATSSGNVELGKNVCTIIIGTCKFTVY